MKRALLIAGGTLGGLGAVLAITPPQLSSSESSLATGLDVAPASEVATTTQEATPTTEATPSGTKSATSQPSASATTKSSGNTSTKSVTTTTSEAAPTATAEPSKSAAPTQTQAASGKAQSGTFTGDPYTMRYGTVQVKITIANGKITDAVAVQAPSGRDQRYTDMAVPVMRQKTLAAQSSNITGVSGASYTAYAWYISLQSALSKAGWM